MGTQQFCLKWNNHQTNMLTVFDQLLSSEALVDVTLACEGLSLKAHKMVLSACSPFFQSLFLENPCKHPIVIMKDMKYTDLKAIVDFMYRGEVNVSQDQLSALLKTAETLKVKGLAEVTGDNRHGGPGGLVQQEIIQQHLVNTPQSLPASGAQTQHRAESPPLSRRKRGRPRRRSLSGSNRSDSEDQVPSKIKEPDSPEVIEEVTSEVESTNDARQRLAPSGHPQSQVSSLHSVHHGVPPLKSHGALPSQQDSHMSVEEPSGDEGDYDVEPSKLMEQTMTTENVPVFTDGPSQGPTLPPASTQLAIPTTVGLADTQPLHTGPGPCDSQALVPCSMPSEPSTSSCVSQDNNQDIKPGALVSFEEPPISPVAGPSHQDSSNSMMMYMDTSGVPAIPGPSSYQLDKQPSQPPQQQQPQGDLPVKFPKSITITTSTPVDKPQQSVNWCGWEKFSCMYCSQSFYWKWALQRHLRESHNVGPAQMGAELEIAEAYRVSSVKRGRKPGSRLCAICKKVFCNSSELTSHMASHCQAGEVPPPSSPVSKPSEELDGTDLFASSGVPETNNQSLDLSAISPPHNCAACNVEITSLADFHSHLTSNPMCRVRQFDCHLCPKSFIWPVTLAKHLKEHTISEPSTTQKIWFFCDICRKALLSRKAVLLHKKKFHPEQFTHQYEPAMMAEEDSSELGVSSQPCMIGLPPKPYYCDDCGKTFISMPSLRVHRYYEHKCRKKYPCMVCGKVFKRKHNRSCHYHIHGLRKDQLPPDSETLS
ncbi:zinc finger protein 629-like isoform X2 [Centruroides vittatus]|uniref:zinc finger protein 79-like isoform X2 n=1 Tax=Centruroides sculpturatus TaxID=218467 RepID=UPI000C6E8B80|nr:zinc finger protein 79-like isoform X2 [Centruroides sculpturatus]